MVICEIGKSLINLQSKTYPDIYTDNLSKHKVKTL